MKIENQSRLSISQGAGLTCCTFLAAGPRWALTVTWMADSSSPAPCGAPSSLSAVESPFAVGHGHGGGPFQLKIPPPRHPPRSLSHLPVCPVTSDMVAWGKLGLGKSHAVLGRNRARSQDKGQ